MLARLRGKDASELRVGLGRDMRLSAPEMSAAVRTGLVEEGVTVIDAGQIATEISYFLVGSRELDGGAMVTASHNPKAYTGVKLLQRVPWRSRVTPGSKTSGRRSRRACRSPPGGGSVEEIDIYPDFHEHMLSIVDADAIGPLRVLADGSDGCRPDGRPAARAAQPRSNNVSLGAQRRLFRPRGRTLCWRRTAA